MSEAKYDPEKFAGQVEGDLVIRHVITQQAVPPPDPIARLRELAGPPRHFIDELEPMVKLSDAINAVQTAEATADRLTAALREAVQMIRTWHGIGMGDSEAQAWSLYQASPEMQRINIALAPAAPAGCDIQPHMSRVCERGTHSCITRHEQDSAHADLICGPEGQEEVNFERNRKI